MRFPAASSQVPTGIQTLGGCSTYPTAYYTLSVAIYPVLVRACNQPVTHAVRGRKKIREIYRAVALAHDFDDYS